MMKILLFFFMFNYLFCVNKFMLQMFFQNIMFLGSLLMLMILPLNNFNFWLKIYYVLGIDFYSFNLIMLSVWVMILMIMISGESFINVKSGSFFFILLLLLMFLILCFLMMNLLMFYLFFESSLLPIFMLILGWGAQVDRVQAGFYLMLYTLAGSLPLLVIILMIYQLSNSLMFNFVEISSVNLFIYFFMNMAFLIKMPMYFVHLWLPKAHVESPLSGSMILAGVMLKLGSYGILRLMMSMMNLYIKFNKFFIVISLMGGVYSSLICLFQIDLKMLVAYSSIVHMSILMSGMMTLFNWGIYGGILMMIAHGLCSSGLFVLVNVNYSRFKSRSLIINKGLINFFPSLSLMWFLLCSSNLSFPPSLNMFGEIFLLNALISWSLNLILIMILLMFLSASYSLYLYSYSQYSGGVYKSLYEIKNIMILEYMNLMLHWVPLNFMFLLFNLFL